MKFLHRKAEDKIQDFESLREGAESYIGFDPFEEWEEWEEEEEEEEEEE